MSVHSLIDKFSNSEKGSSNRLGVETGRRGSEPPQSSNQQESKEYRPKEGARDALNNIDDTGLLGLLGPNVKSFPFSEEAFVESVKLRAEQEKTKQSYYKLETANKNLLILNTALKAQVPPNLIPMMYVHHDDVKGKDPETQPEKKTNPSSSLASPFQQSKGTPTNRNLYQQDASNSNLVPPIHYKFGGANTPNTSRRPLSPAKIGAAAVANLATPTNTYRTNRKVLPQHQRHFSMPTTTSSTTPYRKLPGDLNTIDTSGEAQAKLKPISTNTSDSSTLHSPLGATSSIQVKPSPAQPLQKLVKLANPPSQESMTSFQHIIQFHHWKPEGPNVGTMSSGSPMKSHKRHKSDNMSIDMPSGPFSNANENNPAIRVSNSDLNTNYDREEEEDDDDDDNDDNDHDIDDEDDDITMDTSTIGDINVSKIPRAESVNDANNDSLLNIGRYPHDILSPSNS